MGSLTASRAGSAAPPAMAMRLLSDERLAHLAAAGSETAFAAIFHRHHQALHRYCHSILGHEHDAADALQNTMVKALRALPGETRRIALRAWLYRIAHNESISLLRERRPESDLELAAQISDERASGAVHSRERLRALVADIQHLTDQQRGALLMRELGGLEFGDVGGALQISAAAAKQSVYEARCALQAMEEGRAIDCDVVRRTLSDGDRRTLRAMKLRGHLRACAGCRDFETALRKRPTQLAALAPPLPLATAAAMLHGVLGGSGHAGGGGLLASAGAAAKAGGACSVGAKVATIAAVAGSVAGGIVYVAPIDRGAETKPSATTRDAADRGGRSVATSLPAARDHDDVLSPRPESRRVGRAAEASSRTAPTTDDRTRSVARRQPEHAGAAPPSISGDGGVQLPAETERGPASGNETTGVRPESVAGRPTQTTSSAPAAAQPATTTPAIPIAPPAPAAAPTPVADRPAETPPAASGRDAAGATARPAPR